MTKLGDRLEHVIHDHNPVAVPSQPEASQPPVTATIVDLFRDRVARSPDRPALRFHVGSEWSAITWREYGTAVDEVAAGLVELGVAAGERVGILSSNQVRWHQADLGTMSAGAVSVPLYPTSASGQLAYVLRHSGARVCFVEDRDQLAKVLLRRHDLPDLARVVLLCDVPDGLDDDFLLTFDDLRGLGRDCLVRQPTVLRDRCEALSAETTATIVYTSGTTGPPKGAVLSYGNLSATIRAITSVVPIGPDDRFLSFLPLSHIAERMISHFGQLAAGGETWFARSLATVPDDLRACRPTLFFAVPRVWEKFKVAILDEVAVSPRPARALAERYLEVGARVTAAERAHTRPRILDRVAYAALDRVVGAKIRQQTGLDRARFLVSGAAPIHPDLLWWFSGLGLPIAEVYGQTEDCGPTTLNPPGRLRIGSTGLPLPGVEVRIEADGEILARGRNVCSGYLDDAKATKALLDDEGWMHSGDLGRIDADGYLYVTGRKKDLIITSSGKNIAPQALESRLRSEPLLSQAVVIGDGRPYLTALLALDSEAIAHWSASTDGRADFEALSNDPALREEIGKAVDTANEERSRIEQIKQWRILPRELTVAGGELTPTLKIKRDVVAQRFADLIEEMYAERGA
jgi:long-chain acyl-CoA synthetase